MAKIRLLYFRMQKFHVIITCDIQTELLPILSQISLLWQQGSVVVESV